MDLHTHPFEAMGIANVGQITVESVERILAQVLAAGLDGIAITEHAGMEFGLRAREIAEKELKTDLVILPGEEVWYYPLEIVQILLPDGEYLRFVAHPGAPGACQRAVPKLADILAGIEISNTVHDWHIDEGMVRDLAERHDLMLFRNSDAHDLADIGTRFNEVEPLSLAQKGVGKRWDKVF